MRENWERDDKITELRDRLVEAQATLSAAEKRLRDAEEKRRSMRWLKEHNNKEKP